METLLPLVAVLVAGPASDRLGRRWFILCNLASAVLLPVGYLVLCLLPRPAPALLLLPSLLPAAAGLDWLFWTLVYSYAGDLSHGRSEQYATVRFIIIDTLNNLAAPLGIYTGSALLRLLGLTWLFAITGVLSVITLALAAGLVHDVPAPGIPASIPDSLQNTSKAEPTVNEKKNLFAKGWENVRQLFSVLKVARPGWGRTVILLLLLMLGTHSVTYTCDNNISFLFLQQRFGYDQTQFAKVQGSKF